jgi:hypothetical protein
MERCSPRLSLHSTVDFFDTPRLAFVDVALGDEAQGSITISVLVRLCLTQHNRLPFCEVLLRRHVFWLFRMPLPMSDLGCKVSKYGFTPAFAEHDGATGESIRGVDYQVALG